MKDTVIGRFNVVVAVFCFIVSIQSAIEGDYQGATLLLALALANYIVGTK